MKRKRGSDSPRYTQTCDLLLIDANGRSVRVKKALLIDKSDYFAQILQEHSITELHLNENYLIELINYIYSQEAEDNSDLEEQFAVLDENGSDYRNGINDDLEILMNLLSLSKKYSFRQLYQKLKIEINCKLNQSTILQIYRIARMLSLEEFTRDTKLMILSWLPTLQKQSIFLSLPEDYIRDIFSVESFESDIDCKLDALTAWWTHNKQSDMTDLWKELITHLSD